jgi:nicotinate dehydrogenase subunit B
MTNLVLSRRRFAQVAGIVVATFAVPLHSAIAQASPNPPFSLRNNRKLEGWIRLQPDDTVVVFTGKAELGQGILTALGQIAAEELDVEFDRIRMISADTSRGPDEQYTYGSQSIEQSGAAIRVAAAEARAILLAAAARRFGVRDADLKVAEGMVVASDGRRSTYWQIASAEPELFKRDIAASVAPKRAADYKIVGRSLARVDLPAKLFGLSSFVQDMRLPGMVFARVVRPPRYHAKLVEVDESSVRSLPGFVRAVVCRGAAAGRPYDRMVAHARCVPPAR